VPTKRDPPATGQGTDEKATVLAHRAEQLHEGLSAAVGVRCLRHGGHEPEGKAEGHSDRLTEPGTVDGGERTAETAAGSSEGIGQRATTGGAVGIG